MTCFIPTLVLCHKNRGKSSHNSGICLKRVEKVPLWQDRTTVLCCCVWNVQKNRQTFLQIGAQVLVKSSLCHRGKRTTFPLTLLDGTSPPSLAYECCNWTLRGLQRERERCDVVLKLLTNHIFLTSVEVHIPALAFPNCATPIATACKIHTVLFWTRQVKKTIESGMGVSVDLIFPKSLEFYLSLQQKCVSACAVYVKVMDGGSVFQDYVLWKLKVSGVRLGST